jgi:TPR repeat protein
MFITCRLVVLILGISLGLQAQVLDLDIESMRRLAERGDADAQYMLGLRQIAGQDIAKNPTEGIAWLERAAKAKHLRAQFMLGSFYEDGVGVKRDLAKAVEWYRRAADAGLAPAQFAMAAAYELGIGVAKDEKQAVVWLKLAAEQNNPQAQTALAMKYETGTGGLKADPVRAAQLYLEAANQDWVQAMSRLAHLYYTGQGVPLDYRRAGAWYQRASRSEDPWASNNLAWFLATCPDHSLHDPAKASEFANRALRLMDDAGEPESYEMYDTKAACLARQGDFLAALLWQKKALELMGQDKDLPEQEQETLKAEFLQRLRLYQLQTPYTDPSSPAKQPGPALPADRILQDEPLRGGPRQSPKKKANAPQKGFA